MQHRIIRIAFGLLCGLLVLGLAACGGGGNDTQPTTAPGGGGGAATEPPAAGDAAKGQTLFAGTCSACHGPDAKGIAGLGKDLTTSQWVADQSDTQLVEFLKVGRPASDPLNTTGVDMPPRGGNPALSDEDLTDIVAYIRSINNP